MDIEDLHVVLKKSKIISCSRRTDIPAFYMNEMLEHMKKGYISVPNPRNAKITSNISLSPGDVIAFAWWSKDYSKWIEIYEKNKELFKMYTHYFNFTINSRSSLEPNISSTLDERLDQLKYLADEFSPIAINYRFDPIVFYHDVNKPDKLKNNLRDFEYIVSRISSYGITKVNFSFCLPYKNVKLHMKQSGKELVDIPIEKKKAIINWMIDICDGYHMILASCAQSEFTDFSDKLVPSKCINGDVIEKLSGVCLKNKRKDTGQRKTCNCTTSRDIGCYTQLCKHRCAYCYARPDL